MVFIGDLANIGTLNSTNTVSIVNINRICKNVAFCPKNVINAIFDCRLVQNMFCHKQ